MFYFQSLVGDTAPVTEATSTAPAAAPAVAAAAAESNGNDLGFLDVQVPSAQEVQAEQTQQNKMANIMNAFGGAPAAAPMVLNNRRISWKISEKTQKFWEIM